MFVKVGEKPDKAKADHGRVEYKVQSRLMAAEILAQHLTLCTAHRANIRGKFASVRNIKKKRTHPFPVSDNGKELALCRWAFAKMNERFHKCARNKVRPIEAWPTLLFSSTFDMFCIHPIVLAGTPTMESGGHSVRQCQHAGIGQAAIKPGDRVLCRSYCVVCVLYRNFIRLFRHNNRASIRTTISMSPNSLKRGSRRAISPLWQRSWLTEAAVFFGFWKTPLACF